MELNSIFSDFHKTGQEYLEEAGISRLVQWMLVYDTGTISAFRHEFNKVTNLQRNSRLLAQLQSKRFSVISVKGGYIENYGQKGKETPVHENTFFVVDKENRGDLCDVLRHLGEEYQQDSIMFIPRGGMLSQLWGTKNEKGVFFEYGLHVDMPNLKIGYKRATQTDPATGEQVPTPGYNRPDPEFFTLKAHKPFFFESVIHEHVLPEGYAGRLACKALSKARIEEQGIQGLGYWWYPEEYS
jgi:hypothetical protein